MSGGPAINDLVAAAFSSSEGDGSAELHESVEAGKSGKKGPGAGSKVKTKEKLKSASYKKDVQKKAEQKAAAAKAAAEAAEEKRREEEAKKAKEKEKGGSKIPNNYGFPSLNEWASKQAKGKYTSPSQMTSAYNAELTHFNAKHESKKS